MWLIPLCLSLCRGPTYGTSKQRTARLWPPTKAANWTSGPLTAQLIVVVTSIPHQPPDMRVARTNQDPSAILAHLRQRIRDELPGTYHPRRRDPPVSGSTPGCCTGVGVTLRPPAGLGPAAESRHAQTLVDGSR
ncbi:hypothetical protein VTJ04DRAFT_10200 [Mycothermus thermophilus]|uniref:uncharacterized protein n=1 Tax=Humicola insolens TaxID=85995 RepID=UPI0037425502